ncbi:MAG: hypothetical protein HRT61_23085, partial [Ekhidna sp.]|nr:hypothetical protein [Ekhidna sp.]
AKEDIDAEAALEKERDELFLKGVAAAGMVTSTQKGLATATANHEAACEELANIK